jgi:EmrB/QacA subfamily drug resistance transporter
LVVVVGVLITAVDTTIVVLALPEIQRTFHIGLSSVIWVIIGYLFVITLVSTQVGRLGDMYGRVLMYESGFVIFVVGSLACALAWNELSLIVFRLVQGVGGAFIAANSGAVIADTFPREKRGRAYGFNAIGFNTGAVLGVVLGGVIVTYVSWRWIFWINVPIGIGAVVMARRVLFDRVEHLRRRVDWWGMLCVGLGLFCLLWAMIDLISESLNPTIVGFFLGGLLLLVVFWKVEQRTSEPLLDFSLFRVPSMTPSLFAALLQSLANFAVLFLLLMYLQGVRRLDPIHASLLLVPGYVVGGIVGPFAGRLADRRGAVLPATAGLAIQVLALLWYAQLEAHSALWVVVVAYMVGAIGAGCFFPSNNSAVMKVAPRDSFGITSGLLRTFANVGMVFSFALAILVASTSISRHVAFSIFVGTSTLSASTVAPFIVGLHAAFYSSTSLMVFAGVLSAVRARPSRSRKSDSADASATDPTSSGPGVATPAS